MIVWGGSPTISTYLNTGGRYNPGTDSWTATNTTNAPTARRYHSAVWAGNEMIVWGGYFQDNMNHYWNTGGRYDPISDSWTATSTVNAPDGRAIHTAIWTGSQMVVWGGTFYDGIIEPLNTGGIYSPAPILGQRLVPPMCLTDDTVTRQCGPAAKSSSGGNAR